MNQSLTGLRMAFVEAVDGRAAPAPNPAPPEAVPPVKTPEPPRETPSVLSGAITSAPVEEESRKKFSKKY